MALTSDNIAAWRSELHAIDLQLARRPRLPPLLENHLGQRRADIAAFLARNTDQDQP